MGAPSVRAVRDTVLASMSMTNSVICDFGCASAAAPAPAFEESKALGGVGLHGDEPDCAPILALDGVAMVEDHIGRMALDRDRGPASVLARHDDAKRLVRFGDNVFGDARPAAQHAPHVDVDRRKRHDDVGFRQHEVVHRIEAAELHRARKASKAFPPAGRRASTSSGKSAIVRP